MIINKLVKENELIVSLYSYMDKHQYILLSYELVKFMVSQDVNYCMTRRKAYYNKI